MARYPTRFQIRTLWNAATGVSILVLGALLVGLIWLIGTVFGFLQPVLVPLAVAAITAYLLDPIVRIFQKRGFSRRNSVIAVFASFILLFGGLVAIMIPLVGGQIHEFGRQRQELAASNGNGTATENQDNPPFDKALVDTLLRARNENEWAKPFVDPLLERPKPKDPDAPPPASILPMLDEAHSNGERPALELKDTELWAQGTSYLTEIISWLKGGAGKLLGFLGLALGFVMVPIYLYYILNESSSIKEHWHEYVPLKASRFKTELVETLTEINRYLISFFRGQVLVAFIDGMLVGVALTIYDLPLGLLVGILMAILGIIPYIGNIITLIPACVLAYFHFSIPANQHILGDSPWAYVGGVIAIFVIVQQINSLLTAPKIVGDSVGLHPMTVIFSMLFWSLILGGFVGALLAVPLTAAVKVLFRRYIWERKLKEDSGDNDDGYEEWQPSSKDDPDPVAP